MTTLSELRNQWEEDEKLRGNIITLLSRHGIPPASCIIKEYIITSAMAYFLVVSGQGIGRC
jgi:hypothetical protein